MPLRSNAFSAASPHASEASPNPPLFAAPRRAPQAMQEVPVVFFQRDFDFAHPDTFAAVCGATDVPPALARPPFL